MAQPPFRRARLQHELATTAAGTQVLASTAISQYGDWLTTVALLTVLYQATNSAVGPAAYMLFRAGPRILGAAPGGHLADRYTPQVVTSILLILQGALTLGILVAVNQHSHLATYITVALAQVCGAAARPLFPALIGIHSPPAQRATFNSIDQILADSAIFVAPAIGAALLALTSIPAVIAIDCVSFAVAAALTITLPKSKPGGIATNALTDGAAAGFRFVWRQRPLRMGAVAFTTSGAAITLVQAVLVVAAAERFGGAGRIGFCYSAVGIGGVLGGMVALRLRRREITRFDIYATALIELLPLAVLALVLSLPAALVLLFISGASGTLNWTFTTTYMQNHAPATILGRVSAALTTLNFIGMVVGAAVALALATALGWSLLLLLFTLVCVAALTLFAVQG